MKPYSTDSLLVRTKGLHSGSTDYGVLLSMGGIVQLGGALFVAGSFRWNKFDTQTNICDFFKFLSRVLTHGIRICFGL